MKHEEAMRSLRFLIACSATLLVIVTTFATPASGPNRIGQFHRPYPTDHGAELLELSW